MLWILISGVATILSLFIYTSSQQVLRQSANDPQIQIAEDTAALLAGGVSPQAVVAPANIDMEQSLAPFVMIFDNQGKLLISTAKPNTLPKPPQGVFENAKNYGQNRFTWQPREDVRIAAVVVPYQSIQSGFVLVGRSLREVEKREERLMFVTFGAFVLSILVTTCITGIIAFLLYQRKK